MVWSIAGSDSGGGAGLQADLKDFQSRHKLDTVVILNVSSTEPLPNPALWPATWAEAEASLPRKLWLFAAVFVPTTALTLYTMVKSKRLSDFLDAVSDERLSAWQKLKAFAAVWRDEGR